MYFMAYSEIVSSKDPIEELITKIAKDTFFSLIGLILETFMRILGKNDYLNNPENFILFKVKPLPGEDSDLTIAGSKRALLAAMRVAEL